MTSRALSALELGYSPVAPGEGGQLLELPGEGRLDLVAFEGPSPGFFERTDQRGWAPFRAFEQLPDLPGETTACHSPTSPATALPTC
ncbi:hypothetical protein [Streptomyces sp. NBC_00887]|uniref:hypothetical protein n=1 Tax=Streptomyces sp. NBC_00887 TaxID=2975859 RepID=UPI003868B8F8|nr:hypothetical protein OG844_10825 [Streptomyces sp. NBC_00887]